MAARQAGHARCRSLVRGLARGQRFVRGRSLAFKRRPTHHLAKFEKQPTGGCQANRRRAAESDAQGARAHHACATPRGRALSLAHPLNSAHITAAQQRSRHCRSQRSRHRRSQRSRYRRGLSLAHLLTSLTTPPRTARTRRPRIDRKRDDASKMRNMCPRTTCRVTATRRDGRQGMGCK